MHPIDVQVSSETLVCTIDGLRRFDGPLGEGLVAAGRARVDPVRGGVYYCEGTSDVLWSLFCWRRQFGKLFFPRFLLVTLIIYSSCCERRRLFRKGSSSIPFLFLFGPGLVVYS